MNRAEFQGLAQVRIDEAKALLDLKMFDGAYYLAGYAVECALKACIAKLTQQDDFPPKLEFVRECYTHKLESLARSAGLGNDLRKEELAKSDFFKSWGLVTDWNESSRYERKTENEARNLHLAIVDPDHGVLPWIKDRW